VTGDLPGVQDVHAARRRIGPYVFDTPLVVSDWLSSLTDGTVHLKLESLQQTGSFKMRGALNAALSVAATAGPSVVLVTASAGNHGRALAQATERLGLSLVVFTPASAPATKKAAIRRHGAVLRDDAADYDDAERAARRYADSDGAIYISPYNHPDVIAGAGTCGLDIVTARPDVDVVVVPLGGGGLASGVGLAVKAESPHTRIIGVEVEASSPFTATRECGRVVSITPHPTLADGLAGNVEPGSITVPLVQKLVDDIVTVSEEELIRAMCGLAAEERLIVEGAGAAAVAAVLAGKARIASQTAVVMVTGSNIDVETFVGVIGER